MKICDGDRGARVRGASRRRDPRQATPRRSSSSCLPTSAPSPGARTRSPRRTTASTNSTTGCRRVTPADQARRLEADREFLRAPAADRSRRALAISTPSATTCSTSWWMQRIEARAVPRVARAAQQRQRLLRRPPAAARPAGAAHDARLRQLHRAPRRRAALLPREHREHAPGHRRTASCCRPRSFPASRA